MLCSVGPLVNGEVYSTPNQYQPLFSVKDHCLQNSKRSDNYTLSYHIKIILSTDRDDDNDNECYNIIWPQNVFSLIKMLD